MPKMTLFLSIFLLLTGCNKDDSPVPDIYSETASAFVNDILWEFKIQISDNRVNPSDSLILAITNSSTEDGEIFKSLSITRVKPIFQYQIIEIQNEGADLVMVKPALAYLDIISDVKASVNLPVVAYNVSGEYAMIKSAAQMGWLDETATMMETLIAIKRSGADLILTYFAKSVAELLSV